MPLPLLALSEYKLICKRVKICFELFVPLIKMNVGRFRINCIEGKAF